jgi:hypothetical protein
MILNSEYQFVYPDPKGSELIVPAPFRVGVFRENQFADWVDNRISIKVYYVFIKKVVLVIINII